MFISFQSPPSQNASPDLIFEDTSKKTQFNKTIASDRIWVNNYGLSSLERIFSGDPNLNGIYLLGKDTYGKDMIVFVNLITYEAQWNVTNLSIRRNIYGAPLIGLYDIYGVNISYLIGINDTTGFIISNDGNLETFDWDISSNVFQIGFDNFTKPTIYIAENNGTHNIINIIHNDDLTTVDAVHVINNTISSNDFVWTTTGDFLGNSVDQIAFMTKGGKGNLTIINGTDGTTLKIKNITITPDLITTSLDDDLDFLVSINATGDKYMDILLLQNGNLYLFGGYNFTQIINSTWVVSGWNFIDYKVCDFDNDDKDEIAVGSYSHDDRYGYVEIFEPLTMNTISNVGTELIYPNTFQVFDYNNDGYMDLLIADSVSAKILDVKNNKNIYESHEFSVVATGLGDFSADGVFDTIIGEKYDLTGFETDRVAPHVSEVTWSPKHPTQKDWEITIYAKIEDTSDIIAKVNYTLDYSFSYQSTTMNLIDTDNKIWSGKITDLSYVQSIQFKLVISDSFGNSVTVMNGTSPYSVDVLSEKIWENLIYNERLVHTDVFTYRINSDNMGVAIFYHNLKKLYGLKSSDGTQIFNRTFNMNGYIAEIMHAPLVSGNSTESFVIAFFNTTLNTLNVTLIDGLDGRYIRSMQYNSNASVIDMDYIYQSSGTIIYLTLSNNTVIAISENDLSIQNRLNSIDILYPGYTIEMIDIGNYLQLNSKSIVIYINNGTSVYALLTQQNLTIFAYKQVDIGNAVQFVKNINGERVELAKNVVGTLQSESIFVISYGFQFKVFSIDWTSANLYSCTITNAQLNSLTLFDLNNDGQHEIIIGYNNGTVGALDSNGKVIGSITGKPKAISAIRFVIIYHNLYSIIRTTDGNIYAISVSTSEIITDFATSSIPFGLFDVRDFNNDGEYELLCITNDYPVTVALLTDLNKYYMLRVSYTAPLDNVYQSSIIPVEISIKNYFGENIRDAEVTVIINNSISVYYNPAQLIMNNYTAYISTSGWDIGIYTMKIEIKHNYYVNKEIIQDFVLHGYLKVEMFTPSSVIRGENITLDLYVTDVNQIPFEPDNVTILLSSDAGYSKEIILNNSQYGSYSLNISTSDMPIGKLFIQATAHSSFTDIATAVNTVSIKDYMNITVFGPGISMQPITQGETLHLKVNLQTAYGAPMSGGSVMLSFAGKFYTCTDMRNGSYIVEIATTNWNAGFHPFIIHASHPYGISASKNSTLFIMGEMNLDVVLGSDSVYQNGQLRFLVYATDKYGTGIQTAQIQAYLAGQQFTLEHVDRNIYQGIINVGNLYHGTYNLTIHAIAQGYSSKTVTTQIEILVQMPNVSMDPPTFGTLMGISILISIIGLYIYYLISRRLRLTREKDIEDLEKSLKSLDILYVVLLIISGILGGAAYLLANMQHYSISISIAALLLLLIIALYALWLYRDVNSFMAHEKFRISRALLGLWHLLLVPIIIYGIFEWGHNIEWFSYYVLGDILHIGNLIIPKLYINLMGTYVTTMVLVVILTYKNLVEDIHRIKHMKGEGTPNSVIISEKIRTISKALDSIRIKMLIFLAILGVSVVTTMDVFRFMQLGIIILTPLLLIVVLPWIVYKVLSVVRAFRRIIFRSENT